MRPTLRARLAYVRQRLRPLSPVEAARAKGAVVGEEVLLPPGSRGVTARATIGDGVAFEGPCRLSGAGTVSFGPWCAIGFDLVCITSNHDTRLPSLHVPLHRRLGLDDHLVAAHTTIGPAVWIGDRVTVLPGAHVGAGAVIAAGAVVRGRIEPFTIAGGVPARPIRRRFADEVCDALLAVAWWDWPLDRMRRNRRFFELDLTVATPDDVRAAVVD